jgi:uncharacterized membrane protein YedE/YeeE
MSNPQKVLAFLRPLHPSFDPSLAVIVISGVLPNGIHWLTVDQGRKVRTLPWEAWKVPSRKDVDWRLIFGSAIFGVGWGLAGICPGPVLVGLGEVLKGVSTSNGLSDGGASVLKYITSMVIGMGAARYV